MITLKINREEISEIIDIFFHEKCRYSSSENPEAIEYCERIENYINQISKQIKEEQ